MNISRDTEIRAEGSFPITARSYTSEELLDGTDCEILIDKGTSKSYMSKSCFLHCKSVHVMPKFTSITKRIQVCNGQYVGVLFMIPVIITIQKHRFAIFTLVSEIHENVNLVLGIENLFELEGVIDSKDFLMCSQHNLESMKSITEPLNGMMKRQFSLDCTMKMLYMNWPTYHLDYTSGPT